MAKQLVKGLTMVTLIVTVAFATAVVSANAQTSLRVKAHVPFEFIVGDKTLPAGNYEVRSASQAGPTLMIQNAKAAIATFRLSNPIKPKNDDAEGRLVFHRYGQNYFLREVWEGGTTTGRELNESKREKTIKRELAMVAKNDFEVVEIVASLQ